MYEIAVAVGVLLGSGLAYSRTMENGSPAWKNIEAAEEYQAPQNSGVAKVIASSFTAPQENFREGVFKSSYVVPYGWHRIIEPEISRDRDGRKYRFTFTSSGSGVAKVDKQGRIFGVREGEVWMTARSKGNPQEVYRFRVQVERESKGWHSISNTKKYYVKGNGKRALGYRKIGKDAYFFDKGTSYRVVKKWRYVKWKGKKYKLYFGRNGKQSVDVSKILPSSARYLLDVNLSRNIVMVYAKDGRNGYIIPVKAMICSGGMKGHQTITGEYHSLRKAGRWHVLRYQSYGQYATRIKGPYLFHSVTYDRYGDHNSLQIKEYKKLGRSASHGCIRLQVKDAKWIYDNSSRCSATLYYDKKKKTIFSRPKAAKVGKAGGGRYYDRTDSARKY